MEHTPPIRNSGGYAHRAGWLGWIVPGTLSAGVVLFVFGVIAAGLDRGRGAFDQINFHLPTVRQFAADWPRVDLHDYLSATSPGYHLALALGSRVGLESVLELRLLGSMFSVLLAWLLGVMALRRWRSAALQPAGGQCSPASHALPLLCCLPAMTSMYVLSPAGWLQPDNAGWLGVLGLIALTAPAALDGGRPLSIVRLGACAVVLTALVFVRQSHLWAAALVWTAAWIGAAPIERSGVAHLLSRARVRITGAGVAVVATLPAIAMLWWLRELWGGLTPPTFRAQHAGGFNPATPALALALLGVYSVFFAGWVIPRTWIMLGKKPVLMMGVALAGAVAAAIPRTTYLYEERASGLWNIVKAMEDRGILIAGRTSPLMVGLSALGAVCLAAWLGMLRPALRWYAIVGLSAFVAAQTANSNAWQRYLEPMLLMSLGLLACGVGPIRVGRARWDQAFDLARWVGPCVLAALFCLLTYRELTSTERWAAPVRADARAILERSGDVSAPP